MKLAIKLALNLIQIFCVRRNQNGLCSRIVLGLRQEISCNPVGGNGAVTNNANLRRSGDRINAYASKYLCLLYTSDAADD